MLKYSRKRKRDLQNASAFKRQTFYALEDVRKGNTLSKVIGIFLFVLIVLNAAIVFVSAQPGLDEGYATAVNVFYRFSTACFCIEYIARIWIADLAYPKVTPVKARFKYVFSLLGIIDLLSFFPNMIAWFFPMTTTLRNIINVVRLVRLVKISRYMRGLRTIAIVLQKRKSEIIAAFLVIALLTVVSSVLMYEIEHRAQPDKFNNLLSGVYWAVTTITGTGYGDLVPITPAGRIVGSIIMFLSVALVAIPGGIFSAGFVSEFQQATVRKIERDVSKRDSSGSGSSSDNDQKEKEHPALSLLEKPLDLGLISPGANADAPPPPDDDGADEGSSDDPSNTDDSPDSSDDGSPDEDASADASADQVDSNATTADGSA